ncbi:MAG: hypothetical protein KY468_17330 [Armatimonadetes bacterium]|nr:hypothetical protein [Armatimonadota bacterium]
MIIGIALFGSGLPLQAQEMPKPKPEIKSVQPYWIPNGKTVTFKIMGQDLAPKGIEFTDKKVTAKVLKVEKLEPKTDEEKAKGNTAVEIELSAPDDLKPDSYAFKLPHDGETQPENKIYIDEATPEIKEKEPNDTLRKPQPLAAAAPFALTGKLDNEGVDVYQIQGKAGEVWRFEILAKRAGSGMDPILRLRDPRLVSVKVAVDNQDRDCALEYKIPADGPYLLEVFDADNRTNKDYFYRLMVKRVAPAVASPASSP